MMKRILAAVLCACAGFIPGLACGGSDDAGLNVRSDSGTDARAAGGSAGSGAAAGAAGRDGSVGSGGSSAGSGGNVDAGEGGIPSTCSTDDECRPAGLVCDPLPSRCVECLFDRDCAQGNRCADRKCRAITTCTNSLDCAAASTVETICDTTSGRCVSCLTSADCPDDNECVNNLCAPYTPCVNSLDCRATEKKICDTSAGRCFECVANADCPTGKRCANRTCRTECASDTVCTPEGLLCDKTGGHCTRCLVHTDCPGQYHCAAGECLLDVCVADSTFCNVNAVVRCTPIGDRWVPSACASRQTCSSASGSATCTPWVCTAGQVECDVTGKKLQTCAADGLSVVSSVDCAASGQVCYTARCQSLACVPSARYCENNTVRQCAADGLSSTLVTTCTTTQYCDDATATCRTRICTPNQPGCDVTRAAVCNAIGSGWLTGGTDCAAQPGQQCSAGACICLTGRASCDGNAANGCEENLSTSAAHCGACDAACSSNNVAPLCSSGNCTGACTTGFADCDLNKRTNGCERDIYNDAQNCGVCARVCSASNMATVTCGGGTCNGNCTAGFTDCDANKQLNGCERNTSTDPGACGGCNQSCSSTNMATRTCGAGYCDGTCVAGFADCDSNKLTNGCEINTRTDPLHCNGCNSPCGTGLVCVNGTCSTCNNQVLLLGDSGATGTHNTQLKTALDAAGLVTTVITNGVNTYSGTPAASGFGAILVPVGLSISSTDMPAAGQTAITGANTAGVGVVFDGWAAYKVNLYPATFTTLRSLLLMQYSIYGGTTPTSYTLTTTGHPIWNGLPSTFASTASIYVVRGPLINSGTAIATCTQCVGTGYSGAGVAVRETTGGRLVQVAHSTNAYGYIWQTDTNLMTMFVNAAKWATRCM